MKPLTGNFISIKAWPGFEAHLGAEVVSISTAELQRGKVCSVNVTLTHPWGNDEGIGGGGWVAGGGEADLVVPVIQGDIAASTNAGGQGFFPEGSTGPDLGLFVDFASRSLHEMTLVGKQLAKSLGSSCPALAEPYARNLVAQFMMNYVGVIPSQCELAVFRKTGIDKCDELDGVKDGIISNVQACEFDPFTVVGTKVECYGKQITISDKIAEIVKLVDEGPRSSAGVQLWDGYDYGVDSSYLLRSLTDEDGETTLFLDPSLGTWVRLFLKEDPNYDLTSIKTPEEVTELFAAAYSQYGVFIGTGDPDLTAFRQNGGKLLSWHGLGDNIIMANNTLRYRNQVEQVMGGKDRVNNFYRLFLAPGVGHCADGYGPMPTSPLNTLVDWVEKNKVPATLAANFTDTEGKQVKRNLCLWPLVSKYKGKGDVRSAASYSCQESY
ncbi:tannase and feruloyl esterase-domain-containing protein [Aspergillus pseudodeflectus]|uniref:Carboxylic ester hydrolase n=1 Tax=Aspergillus pseudodeflectus TaxID=176178 RepID=A0ABR4JI87_9EURO